MPDRARVVTRPVLLHGTSIGTLKLFVPDALHGVDARFITRQYQGVLLATLVSLGLTLLLAAWLAQRWIKPLRAVQLASRELAQGRFDTPLLSALPRNGSQELIQLCSDMRALGEDLRVLERARRQWIAQTSHELRTPLSVLRGEIESVEDGARQPTAVSWCSVWAKRFASFRGWWTICIFWRWPIWAKCRVGCSPSKFTRL